MYDLSKEPMISSNKNQFSPLMVAILKNDRREISKYIKENRYITQPSKSGITPIALAAMESDIDLVKILKQKGANINFQDTQGRTPIMYAAMKGQEDTVMAIKKLNANINHKDIYNKTAKDYFLSKQVYNDMFKNSALHTEHTKPHYNSKLSLDKNSKKLIDAIKRRDPNKVKKIIEDKSLKIDINYRKPSKFKTLDGFTPIMYAALNENIEVAKLLLSTGARVNQPSVHGKTALIVADNINNNSMKEFLINNKANIKPLLETQLIKHSNNCKKKTAIQILMEHSTMENNKRYTREISSFFSQLNNISNYHLKLILNCAALSTKEKTPLKYYFTANNSINDLTMNFINYTTRGEYSVPKNCIRISNFQDTQKALEIFIHETTHKLRMQMNKKEYDDLINSTMEMKNNYYGNKLYNSNTKSSEFFRQHIIERTDKGIRYSNINKIIEENIADYSRTMLYNEIVNKGKSDPNFQKIIKPLKVFFHKKMVPQLEEYIYNHPKRNEIELPKEIKVRLKNLSKQKTNDLNSFKKHWGFKNKVPINKNCEFSI